MTDYTKKATGMTAINKNTATFVLDDRTIGRQLDAFRQYSKHLPFVQQNINPPALNWAQVLLGYDTDSDMTWAAVRDRLVQLYEAPTQADGSLSAEHTFLLAILGMLETPRALLNQFPAQHRSLYYQQMLALTPQPAQADRVTVHFTLAEGAREHVLPAGLLLDAGQDSDGHALRYALAQPLAVNGARITDLRWVVRDRCMPGGRRARVVMDEAAGLPWPQGGVRLFGASPAKAGAAPGPDTDHAVDSGRIVESPVLAVAGGTRTWTVTLEAPLSETLQASVSMGDRWVTLACAKGQDGKTWTVTLPAEGGVPTAVTALEGLVSTAPLLRLTSKTGVPVPPITSLAVDVEGAAGVHCVSDDGTVLTEGGLPFGETADVGQGVNLMAPDWWQLGARLQAVTVTPTWVGLPDMAFTDWYGPDPRQAKPNWLYVDKNLNVSNPNDGWLPDALGGGDKEALADRVTNGKKIVVPIDTGYAHKPTKDGDFTVQASQVLKGGKSLPLGKDTPLFAANAKNDSAPQGRPLSILLNPKPALPLGTALPTDEDDPSRWPWYLRLQLKTPFLQNEYVAHQNAPLTTVMFLTETNSTQLVPATENKSGNTVYKMVESSATNQGKPILMPAMKEETTTLVTPVPVLLPKAQWNPPYVPQWSGVRVDYTALDTQVSQRVILPFGYAPEDPALSQPPAEAELYLGIDGIDAAQLLTLHWQLKSPGALPAPLEWQYLTPGDRWARLPVHDGTNGWQTSGVMSVDWPGDASRRSSSLPPGRLWLRGRARTLTARDAMQVTLPTTPWLSGLVTNAASATLVAPEQVQATHFEAGLPAGQITQALDAPASLQAVTQPWPSEGGRAAQTRALFEAQVARRLRHRERGLNNIDLMTLLQERHAGIREMAVIAAPDADGVQKQTMVVMPGREMSDSQDRRRPGLSKVHRDDMVAELKTRSSPWLELACVNPEYVPVSVSWELTYTPGLSHAVGNARVQAALEATFMPWAKAEDDHGQPVIGRAVTHSAVHEALRRVPEVAKVNTVYLNGDAQHSPQITPSQVVVLTCIPLEYTGLTMAWVDVHVNDSPEKPAYGECTLNADGTQKALLHVTVPKQVGGLGSASIATASAKVYLVDLATGQRLPEKKAAGVNLWAENVEFPGNPVVSSFTEIYADPRHAVGTPGQSATVTDHYFTVSADACGIHHLGVAVALEVKSVPDTTLQSAAVGEQLVLNVQLPEKT